MMHNRSRSLPNSPAIAVDDAEHRGQSGAKVSFPIVGLGACAGGLGCERVSK
jgi:hypothetical protein